MIKVWARTIAGLGASALLLLSALLMMLGERFHIRLGRLPGDIAVAAWEGKNGSFYFPIVTCVMLVSLVLTVGMWIVSGKLKQ